MRQIVMALALGACLLGATSCETTDASGGKPAATVTVEDRGLSEIRLAAIGVFEKNGYAVNSAFDRRLVFDKRASTMTDVAYGGWMDPAVWTRARIEIRSVGEKISVIECRACLVRNRGDATLEEEQTPMGMRRSPFQKLLDEIKARLEAK